MGSLMPFHGDVVPEVVVDALNRLIDDAARGDTVSREFYSERQQRDDPRKRYTGLFFYRGDARHASRPCAPVAFSARSLGER